MNYDTPVTRAELNEELKIFEVRFERKLEGLEKRFEKKFATKDDLAGEIARLETNIQLQFQEQFASYDKKMDAKLATYHKDLFSKLDFLIEQSQVDRYDAIETQVVDHELRILKLEDRR